MDKQDALLKTNYGWGDFVNNVFEAKPPNVEILQVSNVCGELRIWHTECPVWFADLIEYYRILSGETCEYCGKFGLLEEKIGRTVCEDCLGHLKIGGMGYG